MGLVVRPPDVNGGSFKFSVKAGEVIYGLGAIKGLGEGRSRNWLRRATRRGHLLIYLIFVVVLGRAKSIVAHLRL